jgi:hypothetical protein
VYHAPNIAVYSGPKVLKQGVALDKLCQLLDFFFCFIDLNVVAKMKEQINLYSRKKRVECELSHKSRFREWTTMTHPFWCRKFHCCTSTHVHQLMARH